MRRRSTGSDIKRLALGSGLAAVAGYLVGVLTAPKSGKQTRGDIKQAAEKKRIAAEKDLKQVHTDLDKLIKDAKKSGAKLSGKAEEEFKDLLEKALDTKEKVREVLSAIHEGDADDQDLKRAIKNANTALDHLKDFLKK